MGVLKSVEGEAKCTYTENISLTDCLACNGCITSEEAEEFRPDLGFLSSEANGSINSMIISPQVVSNIYSVYIATSESSSIVPFESFEMSFIHFLKKRFRIQMLVNSSYFKKKQSQDDALTISSECPAVVLYVERVFPTLIPILSTHKTYQQVAAEYISSHVPNPVILSVMQCLDKKNEVKRDSTDIQFFIGGQDLYNFIKDDFGLIAKQKEEQLLPHEMTYKYDDVEASGLTNTLNILKQAKNGKLISAGTLELRVCNGGCSGGPALLKGNLGTITSQKEDKIFYPTGERSFNTPRKRTFAIQW